MRSLVGDGGTGTEKGERGSYKVWFLHVFLYLYVETSLESCLTTNMSFLIFLSNLLSLGFSVWFEFRVSTVSSRVWFTILLLPDKVFVPHMIHTRLEGIQAHTHVSIAMRQQRRLTFDINLYHREAHDRQYA